MTEKEFYRTKGYLFQSTIDLINKVNDFLGEIDDYRKTSKASKIIDRLQDANRIIESL